MAKSENTPKEKISPELATKFICLSLEMTFDGLININEKLNRDLTKTNGMLLDAVKLIQMLEDWIDKKNGDESWERVTERRAPNEDLAK